MSLNIHDLFDAGAPHFVPLGSTREILRMDDVIIPEGCGTAGCIAGASFMLADQKLRSNALGEWLWSGL